MEYLKKPELVADIQQYFGVKIHNLERNGNANCNAANRNGFSEKSQNKYTVTNKFWYYVFIFGTQLGDEFFYATFIPFCFWNIDSTVGRRVVLVWALVMYTGQGIKDILRWPRPGAPVVRLQNKWSLEYGMPSTHAMVAVSIPFSMFIYTIDRYQYNLYLGFSIACLWCTIVCMSRLYLGMHTVLDIIAGLLLAVLLMIPLIPFIDRLDSYFLTNPTSPILLLVSSILMIVFYPNSGKWTPTRGDTAMILGVTVAVHIGSTLNYHSGDMAPLLLLSPPYPISYPTLSSLSIATLRTILGFALVFLIRAIIKRFSYPFLCLLVNKREKSLREEPQSLENTRKQFVELSCNYMTCFAMGIGIAWGIPPVFRWLGIERAGFYTDI